MLSLHRKNLKILLRNNKRTIHTSEGSNLLKINMAEEVGFEPTDGLHRQTISSRSRYDHFDTPPYKA